MRIKNPTEESLTVTIFGKEYSVKPLASVEVPAEVASYWRTKLHTFLTIEEDKPVKEEVEKIVKEVKEVKPKK